MNLLIPDIWLRDYLKTEAISKKIGQSLSLCGPSVEKIQGQGKDLVYLVEVTTNRPDTMGVFGIAREAAAILPRFGVKARLQPIKVKSKQKMVKRVKYLQAKVDPTLCPRFSAILIRNVQIKPSPIWLQERLRLAGQRPINNIVDISNYIMYGLGQPVHTFDYDKIEGRKMILRSSKPGEIIKTLDGKSHHLPGGDIAIANGSGKLIDLPGIMGGENSEVDQKTKNVLLFVQTYNPVKIRKTSMILGQRTWASTLFEKDLDPELVSLGIRLGIDLFADLCNGQPEKQILDLYPQPYKAKMVKTNLEFINRRLGIEIKKAEITQILQSLGFEPRWQGNNLETQVPSFRAEDINLAEDIVEEIARIHGYHNLPSQLMSGTIPDPLPDSPFEFEIRVKQILKGYGGVEVYTLSLVPEKWVEKNALSLKNPLGLESKYLRTSLMPSLMAATKENSREKEPFHLFEMANVYLPQKGDLPQEKLILAGILVNYDYRSAKGIIESLLEELNIQPEFELEEKKSFLPGQRLLVKVKGQNLGEIGVLEEEKKIYYQFEVEKIRNQSQKTGSYQPVPKYPSQIEDLTLKLPPRTRVGEVISQIKKTDKQIVKVELIDIYKEAFSFRLEYQNPNKTLTDKEVEEIRNKILKQLKNKLGITLKE